VESLASLLKGIELHMELTRLPLQESEDMVLVRDSARSFFSDHWPSTQAAKLSANPEAMRKLWRQTAAQGWNSVAVGPEDDGLSIALVLLQESGRAGCPLPFMDAFIAVSTVLAKASESTRRFVAGIDDGSVIPTWAMGHVVGDADAGEVAVGERINGRIAFVEHTAIATHVLVPFVSGQDTCVAIVPLAAPGVSVCLTPGLSRPALAEVSFSDVAEFEVAGMDWDGNLLGTMARLMLAARSLGSAAYGLELLTEYAKVRTQFGKKIGQYQAIQHKLVNCFISVEICRLSQVAASFASAGLRRYWAAVAAANAYNLLRQVVLELHHGFGAVAFWEEHELPHHFRRIHGDMTRVGGVKRAREDLAATLLEMGSMPDFSLTPRANAFRLEVRQWLKENWSGSYTEEQRAMPSNHRKVRQDFSKKLAARGWLGLSMPKAYGGLECPATDRYVFEEEMAFSNAPLMFHQNAVNMIAPALTGYITDEHKRNLLHGIMNADISIALGYTEPENGSDLAGIKTAARRADNGDWIINGQKIYTSAAGFATHMWLAARTDPEKPRHAGISVFLFPIDTPGITIQPLHGLNDHRSNIVFYDNVRVPASALIGEENGGWGVITTALAFERVTLTARAAGARAHFDKLVEFVITRQKDKALAVDALLRDRLGAFGAEVEAARLLGVRCVEVMERGEIPLWEAAMSKVYAGELIERMSEAVFDLLGPGAALQDGPDSALLEGVFEHALRDALVLVIGGGTNEIQRNLIAIRGLGLPR